MIHDSDIPEEYRELIAKVRNNHPDVGGSNRGAIAEIQIRSIIATERATGGIKFATWALVVVTLGLSLITLLK